MTAAVPARPMPRIGQRPAFRSGGPQSANSPCHARLAGRFTFAGSAAPALQRHATCWPC